MKRRRNFLLWSGVLLVLAGFLSYITVFVWIPVTRDFPWANLLLFAIGGIMQAAGLSRAFRQPEIYRGKILGSIFATISLLGIGLFVFGIFFYMRQVPPSTQAPQAGQKAPDFTLPDQDGQPVALADLLPPPAGKANGGAKGALLIFYRGYW